MKVLDTSGYFWLVSESLVSLDGITIFVPVGKGVRTKYMIGSGELDYCG
jgi:hypothetical protein